MTASPRELSPEVNRSSQDSGDVTQRSAAAGVSRDLACDGVRPAVSAAGEHPTEASGVSRQLRGLRCGEPSFGTQVGDLAGEVGQPLAPVEPAGLVQRTWHHRGSWSPSSWCLDLAVEVSGELVGLQALEANDFAKIRTVDSGSWLAVHARGRGTAVAMRTAILGLAFDHLGAVAAISSARVDNAPSLAVSRRLGYIENGVSLTDSPTGVVELQHLRPFGARSAIVTRSLTTAGSSRGA